ncbi:MAG TPA: hypothetical protein VK791_10610 [bacterium]|jgi:hypothetical protein|nr:hypothetical protein [bacterium]
MKLMNIFDYIKRHPLLYLAFCCVAFVLVYYEVVYAVSPEQARLLAQVKEWGDKSIKSILVEPYEPMGKTFKKKLTSQLDLKKVPGFLASADTKPVVGGHVMTPYECTLTFVSEDGSSLKVLAEVFSDKPTDAYLSNNFWTENKDGTYTQWAMKPVYVPQFGAWLIQNAPEGSRY